MLNSYYLSTKIVNKKYNENNQFYQLFIIAITLLIEKYPLYQDLIERVFQETDFFLEKDSIPNILKKHNLDNIDSFSMENEANETYGISSQGYNFYLDNDNKLCHGKDNSFIACNTNYNNTILLNIFIHEMNHLIKGSINGYYLNQDEKIIYYIIRNGLNIYEYKYDILTDTLYETDYYDTLDEVINTLQTTEMMNSILRLDGIVPSNTQEFIDSLDKTLLTKDLGYEDVTKIFRPLWQNIEFKNLIESNIIEGDINEIENTFNSIVGNNSFINLADLLDDLDSTNNKKQRKRIIKQINQIINKWIVKNKTLINVKK